MTRPYLRRMLIIILSIVVAVSQSIHVFAIPDNLKSFYERNDLTFYDPEATGCDQSTVASSINLTDEQRIAATMIVGFDAANRDGIKQAATKFQIGGVFINGKPDASMNQEFFSSISIGLPSPLLVAADDEGGKVYRFQKNAFNFTLPTAKAMGGMTDDALRTATNDLAGRLKNQGVNMVLAPVVDLDSSNTNNAISAHDRAFSRDPAVIIQKAGIYANSMNAQGLGTSLKHFPGLAKTTQNTDFTYQKIDAPISAFTDDLKPFRTLSNNAKMSVMLSNTVITPWGNDPTSLNAQAVTYLRNDVGFKGLIITDDIAVFSKYTTNPIPLKEAIKKAYTAGVTMPLFMYPGDAAMDDIIKDIKASVPQDTIYKAYEMTTNYKKNLGLSTPLTSGGGGSGTASTVTGNNKDYKGRQILSDDQLKKIEENKPVYLRAAQEAGIPWGMLAVIHLRESSLSRTNPSVNNDGVFQILGSNYPPGHVNTEEEFLAQTIKAATLLKTKSSQPELLAQGDTGEIKDTFFGYNGRAAVYVKQATQLGFSNGYEGSPYVMNIADAQRDPEVNTTSWGQIKTNGNTLSYPANKDYGAFVVYAALNNISLPTSSASCNGASGAAVVGSNSAGANGWDTKGAHAMTIYYQNQEPWASVPYGCNSIVNDAGCGPTSLAMALATLTGNQSITPKTIAAELLSKGYRQCNVGTTYDAFGNDYLFGTYKVTSTDLGTDMSRVAPALKRGSLVLMSQQGPNQFSKGGHILLIRAITSSGNYLVANPAFPSQTEDQPGTRSNPQWVISWPGGFTEYEVSGLGSPVYSSGNVDKLHGSLLRLWELSGPNTNTTTGGY